MLLVSLGKRELILGDMRWEVSKETAHLLVSKGFQVKFDLSGFKKEE